MPAALETHELLQLSLDLQELAAGMAHGVHVKADALYHLIAALVQASGHAESDPIRIVAEQLYQEAMEREAADGTEEEVAFARLHAAMALLRIFTNNESASIARCADLDEMARLTGRLHVKADALCHALLALLQAEGIASHPLLLSAQNSYELALKGEVLGRSTLEVASRLIEVSSSLAEILLARRLQHR